MTKISELHDAFNVLLDAAKGQTKIPFASTKIRNFKKSLASVSLGDFNTVDEKFLAVLLNLSERPTCRNCGKFTSANLKKRQFALFCSARCTLSCKETHKKSAKTLQEKYGVGHNMHLSVVQQKKKQTMLERYGVENPAQSPALSSKIKETRKTKYSVDPLHLELVKRKAAHIRAASFSTNGFQSRLDEIAEATGCTLLGAQSWLGMSHFYRWQHENCGTRFEQRLIKGQMPVCPACSPKSKPQSTISNFLKHNNIVFSENCRRTIPPLELDFVLLDHQIAIEVNGCYWHRDFSTKHPLLVKTKLAAQKGIQVLHFWDFEVNEKPEIVFNIILAKLKLLPKIYARNCKVEDIGAAEARSFLERTHLSGFAAGSKYLALVNNAEIVAVAVFGKNRFDKDHSNELIRFASTPAVVGGLSKLISHFRKMAPGAITTFADRRISNGFAYSRIGFNSVSETSPNYLWIKSGTRLTRYQTMKHRLAGVLGSSFDQSKSEKENLLAAGWYRISDCGNLKLVLP